MSQQMTAFAQKAKTLNDRVNRHSTAQVAEGKAPVAENRKLALTVLVIAVAVVLLVLGPARLKSERHDLEDRFGTSSTKVYVESIYSYVREAGHEAEILAGIGEARLSDPKQARKLGEYARMATDSKDPNDMVKGFHALVQTANAVYTQLENEYPDKDDSQMKDAKACLANINSANYAVEHSPNIEPYWQKARDFNRKLDGFPASFMAWLGGVDEMPEQV